MTCILKLNVFPQSSTQGFDLGFANCPKPFGDGLAYDKFTVTSHGSTLTETGPAKEFFDDGTVVSGAYKLIVTPSTGTGVGTFTLSRGTGAFKRVAASGKLRCTFTSATTATCVEKAIFTHL